MTDKLREAAQQAEREAFEVWAKTQGTPEQGWWFRQLPDGGYSSESPDAAWKAWKARAALAQQEAQGWQPIETAPKDGTVIDLWHEEFGREADCYWGLPHHCCGEMGSLCDSDWHSLEPGWVGTCNEIMSPANAYTHWMPLPPAPDADPTPPAQQPAQRVMLTDEEIDAIGNSEWGGYPSYDREFKRILRAVIEAYERKNGIK